MNSLILEGPLGFYSDDDYCAMDILVGEADLAQAIASHFFGLPSEFEWYKQTVIETGAVGHTPRLGPFRVIVERLDAEP